METAVKLVDVEKDFTIGALTFKALDRVSFSLRSRALTSIIGPYGSGRTVLLNIMGCLCQASSGKVIICGTDATRATPEQLYRLRNEKIGFVSGAQNLIGDLTVLENLELAIKSRGKGDRGRLAAMLEAVGLSKKAHALASRLSALEARRLAIAKSIVGNPAMLICDDPTSGLGQKGGNDIVQLLTRFQSEVDTVVVVGSPTDLLAGEEHSVIVVSGGRALEG